MNLKNLKEMLVEHFVFNETLRELMMTDMIGNLNNFTFFPVDEDCTDSVIQTKCYHSLNTSYRQDGEGYGNAEFTDVECELEMLLNRKGFIYVGVCAKCGQRHVGFQPYKKEIKPSKFYEI